MKTHFFPSTGCDLKNQIHKIKSQSDGLAYLPGTNCHENAIFTALNVTLVKVIL